MSSTATLLAILMLGLANTFAGYRIFLVTLVIAGAVLGGLLGLTIGTFILPGPIAFGIAALFALLAGWLALKLYMGGVAVLGALLGVGAAVMLGPDLQPGWRLAAIGGGAVVGGLLAVPLQRLALALGTSIQGSFAAVTAGIVLFEGGDMADYSYTWRSLLAGEKSVGDILTHPAVLALWIGLAASGAVTQLLRPWGNGDDKSAGENDTE